MMKIKYEAMKRGGQTYTATAEFASKQELFQMIKDRGETVLSTEEVRPLNFLKN